MFDPKSRYAKLDTATIDEDDGAGGRRTVTYVRRRFIPNTGGPALLEHAVAAEDRLDLIAARYLGEPTLFWQLCDANGGIGPEELVARPGRTLKVSLVLP